jgi:hypothetical protein
MVDEIASGLKIVSLPIMSMSFRLVEFVRPLFDMMLTSLYWVSVLTLVSDMA